MSKQQQTPQPSLINDDFLNSVLNISGEQKIVKEEKIKTSIYAPSAKNDGKGGKYISTLRFLPIPGVEKEKTKAIKVKRVYFNSEEHKLRGYYYTLDNFGLKVGDCPIFRKFFDLKRAEKAGNAIAKQILTDFNISEEYFTPVLIVKDKQKSELEGKIMLFKYGKTVLDILAQAENPSADKIDQGIEPANLYHPLKGNNFIFDVKVKPGFVYNEYSGCQVLSNTTPVTFNGVTANKNNIKEILTDIYDPKNFPDINEVLPVDWREDEEVKTNLLEYLDSLVFDNSTKRIKDTIQKRQNKFVQPEEDDDDDLDLEENEFLTKKEEFEEEQEKKSKFIDEDLDDEDDDGLTDYEEDSDDVPF